MPQDEFELDGELLVPLPSPSTHEFRLALNNGSRVIYDDANDSWDVTRPDGTRLRFGSRSGAASTLGDGPGGGGNTFRWALDEVIDSVGNSYRIDYESAAYQIDGVTYWSNIRPQRIRYSFHETETLGAKQDLRLIRFAWEERGEPIYPDGAGGFLGDNFDLPTSYRSGFKIQVTRRLAEIAVGIDYDGDGEVDSSGEQIRRYVFSYTPKTSSAEPLDPPYSQLRSIHRHGSDDVPFPSATTFAYTRPARGFLESVPWDLPLGATRAFFNPILDAGANMTSTNIRGAPYDMNGDGYIDQVATGQDGKETLWEVAFGSADGFGIAQPWWDCGALSGFSCDRLVHTITDGDHVGAGAFTIADVVDMDGDGLPDRLVTSTDPWLVYFNDGTTFLPASAWTVPDMPGGVLSVHTAKIRVDNTPQRITYGVTSLADVNGDGRPDLVTNAAIPASQEEVSVALNNGAGFDDFVLWRLAKPSPDYIDGQAGGTSAAGWNPLSRTYVSDWNPDPNFITRISFTDKTWSDINGDGLVDVVPHQICPLGSGIAFGLGDGWQYGAGSGHRKHDSTTAGCFHPMQTQKYDLTTFPFTPELRGEVPAWGILSDPDKFYEDSRTLFTLIDLNGDGILDRFEGSGSPGGSGMGGFWSRIWPARAPTSASTIRSPGAAPGVLYAGPSQESTVARSSTRLT